MRLVIFDIDGTLVPGASSEVRFARYLWRKRTLGLYQLLAFTGFSVRYLPRFGHHVMEKNKAYLDGLAVSNIQSHAARFVTEDLSHALRRPVVARLRAHQAAGDAVVLLSGTPQFLADALAASLDVPDAMGALCRTKDGRFTMAPPSRHPYGETKIAAAEILAQRAGLPLEGAIAFGDSINDAPLFRRVGEAVVVAPGRRLSAEAAGSGWEVFGSLR